MGMESVEHAFNIDEVFRENPNYGFSDGEESVGDYIEDMEN
jgi:hypothetical protein